MTDDDDDLDPALRHALDSYRVPEAPPALGDRVIEQLVDRGPGRARSRHGVAIAAAAVVAAAALGVVALRGGGAGGTLAHGTHVAAGRETIALGARATAVAEGGADVRWNVDGGGAARVEQRAGRVFYRVERGGPFEVETPAGTVEVTGTCFTLEVESMKVSRQHILGAGLGAAIAAVAVIVVYEGGVRVVNARGSVELAAGERGHVESGAPPVRDGAAVARGSGVAGGLAQLGANASRAELAAQNEAAREQLELARTRISQLQASLDEARSAAGEPSRIDPTKDQLATWAEKCEVHMDAPNVFGATSGHLDPKDAAELGLAKAQIPVFEHALSQLHDRARDEMREIYLAATGNTVVADELTAGSMFDEIFEKALPADKTRARQRISRERAGLAPPPANLKELPAVERALRLVARLGNDLERALGDAIGAPGAHDLRRRYNGWPGMRLDQDGCEDRAR